MFYQAPSEEYRPRDTQDQVRKGCSAPSSCCSSESELRMKSGRGAGMCDAVKVTCEDPSVKMLQSSRGSRQKSASCLLV